MRAMLMATLLTVWGSPPAHAQATPDTLALGRKVYNFRCYYCHGYSGDAHTLATTYLDPPPRDFTRSPALTLEGMIQTISQGRPGTAMVSFASVLAPAEIQAVAAFVLDEFVTRQAVNLRYHSRENGWEEVDESHPARPFATGAIALDTPDESLTPEQRRGKSLFLAACISCHDRSRVTAEGPVWEAQAVSYPRLHYSHRAPDAVSGATPYAIHDRPPERADLTAEERQGEQIYQNNCAFCHAADGTGQNWIGTFLEPHPRNLTDATFMSTLTRANLERTIRQGLPNTSMPAWGQVLAAEEIQNLIKYIEKVFSPLASDASPGTTERKSP